MEKQFRQKSWPINQIFIFTASTLITLFLLKGASVVITPFLLSIAIAIILSPLFTRLESKHIPKSVSLAVVILLSLIPIVLLGGYVVDEAKDFAENYQTIKEGWAANTSKVLVHFRHIGIDDYKINTLLQKSNLAEIVKNLVIQAKSQFSNLFMIFFMVAFMLMESKYFYNKMLKIATDYHVDSHLFIELIEKIKSYFLIKVKTSLATALLVFAVLWFFDISYYYMWAVLAFFMNFIPVIGSILAAIPAVIFALTDHGLMTMVWVATGYLTINIMIGNVIEPRIMGKGLGLSALIIFLSMTFWGWLFGPIGMILSVPLTMITQYLFDQYRETQWIALLLSDYKQGDNDGKNDHASGT